jgi:hypothetical protein
MLIASRKNEAKGSNVLKKIKVEGNVDEGKEVIVRSQTAILRWKGFESQMVIWNRIYEPNLMSKGRRSQQ